ncbi:MAG TPA: SgcJ/EcaC family oxidoreductase [Rubrobacteraceae bacterium]|jgi:uncharacterized protein (TIGR02246 family)|nr:SgcJ/EcaC family oxidoreductase [Rubrobacteraceae bacterium]
MDVQSPEEAVRAMVDAFNSRDLDAFMDFYEPGATLVPQPGQVASGAAAIRDAMGGFLALKGRMEVEPELAVVQAGDVALVSGSWTLTGHRSDGEPVTMSGRVTDVLRRQPDGTWRWVIDVPFGIG